jgi:hypothetical protein
MTQSLLTYEVVTSSSAADISGSSDGAVLEFRLTAPTGKLPLSGGFAGVHNTNSSDVRGPVLMASYPDGQDWVFKFFRGGSAAVSSVDLYMVCAGS